MDINITHERELNISVGTNRKATTWKQQRMSIKALFEKLSKPVKSNETFAEYKAMPKAKQDELKDVGGYMCGSLKDGRRKASNLISRSCITLDADNVKKDLNTLVEALKNQNICFAIHSTRKHTPTSARVRIVIPLNRDVTADEYNAVARALACMVNPDMTYYDATTFDVVRLMYWPSVSCDSEHFFGYVDAPLLDVDAILNTFYDDWTNMAEYAKVPSEEKANNTRLERAKKQQNPLEKSGFIGAFCRTYNIDFVIEKFLSEIYVPGTLPNRYTFTGGSTINGGVVYDDHYIYSHHSTDPAGGQLLNAFDLVRVHKFNYLDENCKEDTPVNRRPSYKAMIKFASEDEATKVTYLKEKQESASIDFNDVPAASSTSAQGESNKSVSDIDWYSKIQFTEKGAVQKNLANVLVLAMNHPDLRGRLKYNVFLDQLEKIGPMPWDAPGTVADDEVRMWTDSDDAEFRAFMEMCLGFRNTSIAFDAISIAMHRQQYNPVQDYLNNLEWDGVSRLDTLYADFFGDADNVYTREVSRKSLCGLVARALNPGCKFDSMTVIRGAQGCGKSTFLEKLGGKYYVEVGSDWNNPKVVAELFQRAWIVEVAEFAGFNRSDVNSVKSLISLTKDTFRPAYGKRAMDHPRHCAFFATTNDIEYLKDPTGNRRYWPISADGTPRLSIFKDLTQEYIDQLWAEAVYYYKKGESLLLSAEAEKIANKRRANHMEHDDIEGAITEYLSKKIPTEWEHLDAWERMEVMESSDEVNAAKYGAENMGQRMRICTAELMNECLKDNRGLTNMTLSRRIARILDRLPEWERISCAVFGNGYGRQRGWTYVGKIKK